MHSTAASTSMEHLPTNNSNYHRSFSSSRIVDCSLRVYRQPLPLSIPENEAISFGHEDLEEHEEGSASNVSDFLFCSPKGRSPNALQTVKQQTRVYPKTISRLLASSPAHQNQFRLFRGMGQQQLPANTLAIPAAPSPCLSPIRYSLDISAIHQMHLNEKSSHLDEEQLEAAASAVIPIQHRSLPNDESSLRSVCLAQNLSTGRILTDVTNNTSIRSSFLRSPRHPNVSGPVLGTPDYLSPEILMQDENHTAAVDFWALGVCLYQFLVGVTPFADECPRAIISNILNYRLIWPEGEEEQLDEDAMSVIKGLLSYEPSLRLQLEGQLNLKCNDDQKIRLF